MLMGMGLWLNCPCHSPTPIRKAPPPSLCPPARPSVYLRLRLWRWSSLIVNVFRSLTSPVFVSSQGTGLPHQGPAGIANPAAFAVGQHVPGSQQSNPLLLNDVEKCQICHKCPLL